jgi:hypothetical protein
MIASQATRGERRMSETVCAAQHSLTCDPFPALVSRRSGGLSTNLSSWSPGTDPAPGWWPPWTGPAASGDEASTDSSVPDWSVYKSQWPLDFSSLNSNCSINTSISIFQGIVYIFFSRPIFQTYTRWKSRFADITKSSQLIPVHDIVTYFNTKKKTLKGLSRQIEKSYRWFG